MIRMLPLGAAPAREPWAARGPGADRQALAEAVVFSRMLARCLPMPSDVLASFAVTPRREREAEHYVVSLVFDDAHEAARRYARQVGAALPRHWDEPARRELAACGLGEGGPLRIAAAPSAAAARPAAVPA